MATRRRRCRRRWQHAAPTHPALSSCRVQGAILTGEAAAAKVSNLLKTVGKSG